MRITKLSLGLWALLALEPAMSGAAEPAASRWLRLETADFSILTDGNQRDLDQFATTYAAFRSILQEQILGADMRLPRSTLVLFRRENDFNEHAIQSSEHIFHVPALAPDVDDATITALWIGGDRDASLETLLEFETIWLLRESGAWMPLWMAQGTGEVMSTMQLHQGRASFDADRPRFLIPLQRDSLIPWSRFFSLASESPEYRGTKKPGVYHGQAWELMRWVWLASNGGQLRFNKLAARLKSRLAAPAIEEVMGVPEAKFAAAMQVSLRTSAASFPFDEKAARAAWHLAPASEAEAQAQLADVLAAAGKTAAAENALARAQSLAPNTVRVLEARARHELRNRREESAAALFRQAIAAGSKNPAAYLHSARLRLDASGSDGTADYEGSGGSAVATALAEIRQALILSPASAHAYAAMGRAYYLAPEVDDGAVAELSRGLGPGRSPVQRYRALLFKRLHRFAESLADLHTVIADPDCPPELRRICEREITTVQVAQVRHQAETLTKDKHYAEARALMWAAKQKYPEASGDYERLAQWIDAQEQTTVFAETRARVENLVLAGNYPEALAVMEAAERNTENAALAKDLGRLHAWLDERTELHRLNLLYQAQQWVLYHDRVQRFLAAHPESAQAAALRQNDEAAKKQIRPAGQPD